MAESSKTADQALAVLLELVENGPLSAAEVADRLGLNRTVAHRMLTTLHKSGFAAREGRKYGPGAVLVRLGQQVQPALRAAAKGAMAELGRSIGESVVLHIADGMDAQVLEQYGAAAHIVRVEHEIGSRHPMVRGASGRALLAYLPPNAVKRIVARVEDPELVKQQLDSVRDLGYAISHDELQNGVHGLAVPVFDQTGHGVASVAIIVPTVRSSGLVEHLDALDKASKRIADLLWGDGKDAS